MKHAASVQHLAALRGKRIAVYGLGNLGRHVIALLESLADELNLVPVAMDRSNFSELLKGEPVDLLIHCAGPTGDFRKRVLDTADAAISATIAMLRAGFIRERLVCVSSVRIYGFSDFVDVLFDEAQPPRTKHTTLDFAYDGTKQLLENLTIFGTKEVGISGVVVRLSNLIGGEVRPERAAMLHHAMLAASVCPVKRLETGQHTASSKDYLHVQDAAYGLLLAAALGLNGNAYNIASGISISAASLAQALGVELICADAAARPCYSSISIEKARRELHFRPYFATREALFQTMLAGAAHPNP